MRLRIITLFTAIGLLLVGCDKPTGDGKAPTTSTASNSPAPSVPAAPASAQPPVTQQTAVASTESADEFMKAMKHPVTQQPPASATDAYRPLKPEDGIQFAAYTDEIGYDFFGNASGTLTKFGITNAKGAFIELELVTKDFKNDQIETKQFGIVRAAVKVQGGLPTFTYSVTDSQVAKLKDFLASQSTSGH